MNRRDVVAAIADAQAHTGATLLVTTHDVELARELGDHVAVLLGGHIVATGPAAELLAGVHDADDLDGRFGFSAHQGRIGAECAAVVARRAQRQGLATARLLMAVLLAVTVAVLGALHLGLLDNPMLTR